MKHLCIRCIPLIAVALMGCQTTPQGGGVSRSEGFSVVLPVTEVVVQQGQMETLTLTLKRGEYFKRDVTLEVEASDGIAIEPARVTVKAGDPPDAQFRISAGKKAAIGGYHVYVKATPETGEATSGEFAVKVMAP